MARAKGGGGPPVRQGGGGPRMGGGGGGGRHLGGGGGPPGGGGRGGGIEARQMMQRLGFLVLGAVLFVGSAPAHAQERFKTTDDAVTALVDAAKAQDKKELLKVLGPKGQQI